MGCSRRTAVTVPKWYRADSSNLASSQEAYDAAVTTLFASLDWLEERLGS